MSCHPIAVIILHVHKIWNLLLINLITNKFIVAQCILLPSKSFIYQQMHSIWVLSKAKLKWSRYRPGVAQRVGRCISLLFHDRGTRRGWVVSSKPRPHFTPGKDTVHIVQLAGWALRPVWRAENFVPTGIRFRTFQPVTQSLYRLSYRAHMSLIKQYNLQQTKLKLYLTCFSLRPSTGSLNLSWLKSQL